MTKIAILDDFEATPAQFNRLESLGNIEIYSGVPKSLEEIVSRAKNADILVVGWTDIGKAVLERLPKLRHIAVWATGYDYIDINAAKANGIQVSNVPGYASQSVAEMTFGLMIALSRKLIPAANHVKHKGFNRTYFKGGDLSGKIIGIVGTGNIGGQVAKIANCFNMSVIAYTKNPSTARAETLGLTYVDFDYLLSNSDYVSLHLSLTEETRNMVSTEQLSLMKPTSYIINTARAAIIDHLALYSILREGKIAGAGLDAIDLKTIEDLLELKNVVATPHMAFYTDEAVVRKTEICIDNIEAFIKNKPQNIVI